MSLINSSLPSDIILTFLKTIDSRALIRYKVSTVKHLLSFYYYLAFYFISISMKRLLYMLPILFIMIMLIINPSRYIESVTGGLLIFTASVLPALFPFFFFTKLLAAMGAGECVARAIGKPMGKLYNCPDIAGYIFVMSIMSGYPIGAKLTADFYEMRLIDHNAAAKITSFTATSGPLFIIGTVGATIIGNSTAGAIILISHYVSALLNGLIYRGKKQINRAVLAPVSNSDIDKILGDSIYSAIISVLIVGGYIAIFNMVGDILTDIGVLPALGGLIDNLFGRGAEAKVGEGISYGLIEITKGVILLQKSGADIKKITALACGVISFGGLSVTFQSLTFLSKCKIKAPRYLLCKLTQSILAGLVAYPLCLIFL